MKKTFIIIAKFAIGYQILVEIIIEYSEIDRDYKSHYRR